jgi:hypothetical protein
MNEERDLEIIKADYCWITWSHDKRGAGILFGDSPHFKVN